MKTLKTIIFTIIALASFLAMLFFLLCALGALLQSNTGLLVIFSVFVIAFFGVSYLSTNIAKQGYPNPKSKSKTDKHEESNPLEASNQETQQDSDKQKIDTLIPKLKDGCNLAYRYSGVEIDELNYDEAIKAATEKSQQLTAQLLDEKVVLQHNGIAIGSIAESRRADMLRDWIKNEEPYLDYLENVNTESKRGVAFLAFYRDKRAKLSHRENDVVKLVRFTGYLQQLAIESRQHGEELSLMEDTDDNGKEYVSVFAGWDEIGRLPAKYANRYMDEGAAGCFFEYDEYDEEKDKNIPFVRIYW